MYSSDSIIKELTKGPPLLPPPQEKIPEEEAPVYIPRNRWQRLLHWEHFGLCVIVAITLILHFIAIDRPPTIVWDETWYVGDARAIISGNGDIRPEHPPLAKLFIVAGMYIFNGFETPVSASGADLTSSIGPGETNKSSVLDVSNASLFSPGQAIRIEAEQMRVESVDTENNQITVLRAVDGTSPANHGEGQTIYLFHDSAWGWRFFSIIFGTIGIILVYFICRQFKLSWKATMIATFLFGFENMTFLHSGLALLDVYMVTFMLAAIYMYLKGGYLLSAIFVALSAECKLAGALIIIAIFLHWLIYRRDRWPWFIGSMALAGFAFIFFLIGFDYFIYELGTGGIKQ